MKVSDMLDLGKTCGLITIREAYSNVSIHAGMLFGYDEAEKELKELSDELKEKRLLVENDDGYFVFVDKTIEEALEELK